MVSFEYFNDACKHLLVDSTSISSTANTEFVVIGGWCPLLRNDSGHTKIKHPGTRDVDLLFSGVDAKGTLGPVVQAFLDHGYLLSAKHDFQLVKLIEVGGRQLAFHIDLLHPAENQVDPNNMFADQLDLGIQFDNESIETKKTKSIACPSSKFIFEEKLYDSYSLKIGSENHSFPLINSAGLVITKSASCQSPKRPRDAFDIFVSLVQKDSSQVTADLQKCARRKGNGLKERLSDLRNYVNNDTLNFDNNVHLFAEEQNPKASELVIQRLDEALK